VDPREQGEVQHPVANFSLHSSRRATSRNDPLDQAVEKLWFNGVFVVAAAGNYGTAGTPERRPLRAGQRPVRDHGRRCRHRRHRSRLNDDTTAPWSAYGYTYDGFAKPEIGAPGRYMVGPVPPARRSRASGRTT
jgi:hypothetical protein